MEMRAKEGIPERRPSLRRGNSKEIPAFTRKFCWHFDRGSRPAVKTPDEQMKAAGLFDPQAPTGRSGTPPWDAQTFQFALSRAMRLREGSGQPPNIRTIRNWRIDDIPQERFVEPILDVLFGNDETLAAPRQELHELWVMARRALPKSRSNPADSSGHDWEFANTESYEWEVTSAENYALCLAALYVHPPATSNLLESFLLQVSLSLARCPDEIEGLPVLIGLKQAHLTPNYVNCQPLPPAGTELVSSAGGLFTVNGPRADSGHLAGDALSNTTLAILQLVGKGPVGITLALRSRRSDLDVVPDDPNCSISAAREKILQRFLQECQQEDADRFITWSRAGLKRKDGQ